ncbi:aquaporin-like isoform X1 [Metopolophium dirhodum]|uniref:aquaporin-like isoform X1 n=2 Tax=Metopolophium dirhodum TaxID=44670 RepID=UPI00298FA273|nr:aquaporin-like isoform X1 [Metopolophium dirhodum]XP_060864974.1 aquaporin-like isoform X1 [Metopolophium dirhodum]XP_060864975.1 aquaporin-like isoform X1 [Metopolophium dirhodum]
MTHTALASKEEEHSGDWIDQDVGNNQENIWLKRMNSTDKFLEPPTGEQKISSVVFDVPRSEMKSTAEPSQLYERQPWQKLVTIFLAELFGTAFLMFFGCMGLVPKYPGGELGQYSGAIAFAGIVAVTIVIIGHISNCHINPCVTLCALLLGKLPILTAIVYFLAEFLGAMIGYGVLVVISPYNILNSSESGVCVTSPVIGLTAWQAVLIEAITTGVLILLVCAVWDPKSGNGDCGPLKFLAMIFVTSVVVGPFTGNSLNPARSLAPAVYNNSWNMHWVYWVGPFSGTITSTLFYKYIFMALDNEDRVK